MLYYCFFRYKLDNLMNKYYIVLSLGFFPLDLAAMEHDGASELKRVRVATVTDLLKEVGTHLVRFEPDELEQLLACDVAAGIPTGERAQLHERATQILASITSFEAESQKFRLPQISEEQRNKFSFGAECLKAKRMCCVLDAFKYLNQFKFPQVHFSPRPYNPDGRPSLDKILEVLIANERSGISACCFHLTLFNVAERLVDKNLEGIHVCLITNQKQGEAVPTQAILRLVDNDIAVLAPSSNSYENNHHKFFIFDSNLVKRTLVWCGSYNPTGHANENSWEDVTIMDDAEVVQAFRRRFEEIRGASKRMSRQDIQAKHPKLPTDNSLTRNKVPDELWKK
jgi:phosphatidylserine/phosphatidylglycerophosphate/cardiolipin synthase-like enzyme